MLGLYDQWRRIGLRFVAPRPIVKDAIHAGDGIAIRAADIDAGADRRCGLPRLAEGQLGGVMACAECGIAGSKIGMGDRVGTPVARGTSHRTGQVLFTYGSSGRQVMTPVAGRVATSPYPSGSDS